MNQPLSTPRVNLRKYTDEDKEIVADFFTDSEIGRYMGDGPCDSRNDAYKLFDEIFKVYEGKPNKHFEVWGVDLDNELIGHIELKQTKDTLPNELEVVYLLDQSHWNKGIMAEILQVIRTHANNFQKTIIAKLNAKNQASIRVLEKIGIEKLQFLDKQKSFLIVTLKN